MLRALAVMVAFAFMVQAGPGLAASRRVRPTSSKTKTVKNGKVVAKKIKANEKVDPAKTTSSATTKVTPKVTPVDKTVNANQKPVVASDTKTDTPAVTPVQYTALIVDITGMKLDKAMSPKIMRKDGTEVWGTLKNLTDEDYSILEDRGMVGYVCTLEEAKANSRSGANPLIIKAVETQQTKPRSNPVVADEDAALILAENGKGKFLEKFNVIFIRNENPPPPEAPKVEPAAPSEPSGTDEAAPSEPKTDETPPSPE